MTPEKVYLNAPLRPRAGPGAGFGPVWALSLSVNGPNFVFVFCLFDFGREFCVVVPCFVWGAAAPETPTFILGRAPPPQTPQREWQPKQTKKQKNVKN